MSEIQPVDTESQDANPEATITEQTPSPCEVDRDKYLRLNALQLAVDVNKQIDGGHSDILKRAKDYYDFIAGS